MRATVFFVFVLFFVVCLFVCLGFLRFCLFVCLFVLFVFCFLIQQLR